MNTDKSINNKAINKIDRHSNIKLLTSLFAMFFIFSLSTNAANNVIISEVLYDPITTETGGEAVELYNQADSDVDISGYIIRTESSAADATLPLGSIIKSKGFFLIADAGWSASKDNSSWPDADYEEAVSMTNTDAGVALLYNGTILDAVGWGNPINITAGLYEGTPTNHVTEGNSLKRINLEDTGNNLNDFTAGIPDLQNSTSFVQQTNTTDENANLLISAEITGSAPKILNIYIADDNKATQKYEVNPVPNSNKTVVISANISDENGADDVSSVTALITGPGLSKNAILTKQSNIDALTAAFSGSFSMAYYNLPGSYNAAVTATDLTAMSNTSLSGFDYTSMTAVFIDTASMSFSSIMPGQSSDLSGDTNLQTINMPTLKNIGNTQFNIGMYGTDLVNGQSVIGVNKIEYTLDGFVQTAPMTKSPVNTNKALGVNSLLGLGLRLNVPVGIPTGSYAGGATIVALP